jgi:uncharacterized protein YjbI with pentapeptide repeats
MKTTIKIKNRFNGKTIFSHTCEDNSIKLTVEAAVKNNINLCGADLTNANLESAKLASVDLSNANLKGANLRFANLQRANLQRDYLSFADLQGAILNSANLEFANLKFANLQGTNLKGAELQDGILRFTDLRGANLQGANLKHTNLQGAKLQDAILRFTDLRGANLYGANLTSANLESANLRYANLQGADLTDSKNINIPMSCPKDGSFISYKKVYYKFTPYLITLEIPEDAKRSSATTNKCRCDKAKVLSIKNTYTNENIDSIINDKYTLCEYRVGETVYPDSFDDNRFNECSHGIHFFVNKEAAIEY